MEEEIIKSILIYDINNRNKIIGRIVKIPKKETLKNVRSKIKKMNDEDEFLMIGNDNNFDAIDKDIEEDFPLEDILIKENEIYKIYIKESDIKNIIQKNNVNTNFVLQNYNIINNKNTLEKKSSNPVSQNNENAVKNNLNQNNITIYQISELSWSENFSLN